MGRVRVLLCSARRAGYLILSEIQRIGHEFALLLLL